MKNHNMSIFYISLLMFIVFSINPASAQDMKEKKYKTGKVNKMILIDSILKDFNNPDAPGANIIVTKDKKILFKKSYGLANLEEKKPINEFTNFRLASITKQFTAMCIMILKENGKLSYENKVTDIFPEFPSCGKKIKIRNLLNHTSGMVDYEDYIPDGQKEQLRDKDVYDILIRHDSTCFEPGTKYKYSNSGYSLLSLIVEKVSGKKFAEFLKEYIFKPLGMSNTIAYEKGISDVQNRAFGYSKTSDGFKNTDQSLTSAVLGDGGVYTSIMDYTKWDRALYTNKIVKQKTLNDAFTVGLFNNGSPISEGYGFGWEIGKINECKIVQHGGSTCGFTNYVIRIPEKKMMILLLTNRSGVNDISKLAKSIVEIFLN
jgi:CubicO group peptidase (beta-lactamase class C family)